MPTAAARATLASEIQTLAQSAPHSPGRATNAPTASLEAASAITTSIGYTASQASSNVRAARGASARREPLTRAPPQRS